MRLTDCTFQGTVIEGNDPKNRGRYRVVIPELMYNIYDKEEGFIYCSNQISGGRNSGSAKGIYGQYFPLHPNTRVSVKFASEDYSSAYINNVVSDFHNNSTPLESEASNEVQAKMRDEFAQIYRSVDKDLITITGETGTENVPANSMAFYHKEDNVKVTFDPDGIHVYTKKDFDQQIDGKAYITIDKDTDVLLKQNLQIKILENNKVEITGNSDITIKGNNKIGIIGNSDITVNKSIKILVSQHNDITISGDSKISIKGNCDLSVGGNCIISAAGKCDINSPSINLNCGPPADIATLTQNTLGVAQDLSVSAEKTKSLEQSVDKNIATLDEVVAIVKAFK